MSEGEILTDFPDLTADDIRAVLVFAAERERRLFTETERDLSSLLEEARREGGVRIRRRDGATFVLRPEGSRKSPLDVDGLSLDLSRDEIVDFVREGREQLRVDPDDER